MSISIFISNENFQQAQGGTWMLHNEPFDFAQERLAEALLYGYPIIWVNNLIYVSRGTLYG
tara:strand:+ start:1965 stop:2147 length:183 start_codon:yes stop_codon:yes gene_type:complete